MHGVTVVLTDDVVRADTFMILAALLIQTTSVYPLEYLRQVIDVDGVENPTECLTQTCYLGRDDSALWADRGGTWVGTLITCD